MFKQLFENMSYSQRLLYLAIGIIFLHLSKTRAMTVCDEYGGYTYYCDSGWYCCEGGTKCCQTRFENTYNSGSDSGTSAGFIGKIVFGCLGGLAVLVGCIACICAKINRPKTLVRPTAPVSNLRMGGVNQQHPPNGQQQQPTYPIYTGVQNPTALPQ